MSIASFFGAAACKKRPRDHASEPEPSAKPPIRTLVAWNANSLLQRVENNKRELRAFLDEQAPDAIFVSEVRMPAAGPPGCKKGDGKPRRQAEMARATAAQSKEADTIASFVRSAGYKAYYSLAEYKYSGAAMLVRNDRAQPLEVRFGLDPAAPASAHHPDGRVILARFAHLELLGTYVPNNGTSEASFARRRQWEAEVDRLLAAPRDQPLVWLGDLNVAAGWHDVGPSPEWFRTQNGKDASDEDDRGQPGFTANEQSRFERTLESAGLVDAYRLLFPDADWSRDVTWRGTPGVNVPEEGRYYGKGMRIDYVCVPRAGVRVERALVCGRGALREGFLGSDHCPLLVDVVVEQAAASEAAVPKAAVMEAAAGTEAAAGAGGTPGSSETGTTTNPQA